MKKCDVVFFEYKEGSYPARDFIVSIKDKKLRNKTFRTIELLSEFGTDLREPYSKSLEDGIFELRSKQGSNITRVLFSISSM